jgi:hypothetical protein
MIKLSSIRQTVIDWIEDDSDTDIIDRTINAQIRYVTKGTTFESLFRTQDQTPTAAGVIVAPPVCQSILNIYPQVAYGSLPDFVFGPSIGRYTAGQPRPNAYLYVPTGSVLSPETTGLNLTGSIGDYTLSENGGTSITADMEGKELRLDGDDTRYLITAATASVSLDVFPPLRTNAQGGVGGTVNPEGRKEYTLLDRSGNLYTDDVTIDYKIDHPPLVLDDDELIIPLERTIALLTVQQFLKQSKYDVDAQRLREEIFEAQHVEMGTEPTAIQKSVPQDTMFAFRSRRGNARNRR